MVERMKGTIAFRTENGSSLDQNLALTVLFVPSSPDSGCDGAWFTGLRRQRVLYPQAAGPNPLHHRDD